MDKQTQPDKRLSVRRMTEEERLHGPDPLPMRWCPICRTHNADPCETAEDMAYCALVPSATETPFARNR